MTDTLCIFFGICQRIQIIFVKNSPDTVTSLTANCMYQYSKQTRSFCQRIDICISEKKLCLILPAF